MRRRGLSRTTAAVALGILPLLAGRLAADAGGPAAAPPATVAAAEDAVVALGRRLFHDPTVSRSGRVSCASCHDPEHGWSDARRLSEDAHGPTPRHSQPVTDLAGEGFHWDGEFPRTRDVVVARIGDPAEAILAGMGRVTALASGGGGGAAGNGELLRAGGGPGYGGFLGADVTTQLGAPIPDRVAADGRYAEAFLAAFGTPAVDSTRIVDAVDAFVRSLRTARNPLDRHLAGDESALAAPARRGLNLFRGRAGCATCHVLEPGADGRAPLTDGRFHNTGVALDADPGRETRRARPEPTQEQREKVVGDGRFVTRGPVTFDAVLVRQDAGRGARTQAGADLFAFKTPSLRDVARRAPYMHDGAFETLEEVVRYYSAGGTPNGTLDPAVRKLDLSDAEVADVVAFLESLTGESRPGVAPRRATSKTLRVRVVGLDGRPATGLALDVVPFGERLGGGALPAASRVTTGADGTAAFEFPETTHVVLRGEGLDVDGGRPIPDTVSELAVLACPTDRIALEVRGADLPERIDAAISVDGPVGPRRLQMTVGDEMLDVRFPEALDGVRPSVETPAQGERFVFERVRALPSGGALYAAPVGKAIGRHVLRCELAPGQDAVACAADLTGGLSPPTSLRPIRVIDVSVGDTPAPGAPK